MMRRAHRIACVLAACACVLAIPASLAAGVPHLDLAIEIDPDARRFTGIAQFDATAMAHVRLHRSLTLHEVTVDGKPVALLEPAMSGETGLWSLPVARSGKVSFTYGGTLPALDTRIDHRGVLRIGSPMAGPEGTFLPSGSHWYPRPAMAFTYRVTLALPASQRGLVAGALVEETLPTAASMRYRAVFEFKQPADGIDLMAGPYVVDEKLVQRAAGGPLRLRTYFTEPLRELSGTYLEDSARYIAMYSQSIGEYPYASFSVVASPLPTGFGMPTLTYMGADVLKLPFIRATSLGHEVLHNWWGNGVYPDYARGNWSEGLTTFMADYAYKEAESAAAARDMRLAWMRDMAAIPAEARMSLLQFRSRTHGTEAAVGYGKAAMVFFMVRDLIGNDAYERGIRLFWERQRFRMASWPDLQRAFEQASGTTLGPFFEQWLRRADAPQLSLTEASAKGSDGRYTVRVRIAQAAPPYRLRVPVALVSGARSETHTVAVEQGETQSTIETTFKPEAVKLDPDLRVWRLLRAEELPPILRLWIIARAPEYVVAAADSRMQQGAARLLRRFFEVEPRQAADPSSGREPLVVVGTHADVDAYLAPRGWGRRPAELPPGATAYVWTVPNAPHGTRPVAVISVRDTQALEALQRPLPHYGAQSYLAFEASRVVARGVWPVSAPAIPVKWP